VPRSGLRLGAAAGAIAPELHGKERWTFVIGDKSRAQSGVTVPHKELTPCLRKARRTQKGLGWPPPAPARIDIKRGPGSLKEKAETGEDSLDKESYKLYYVN